MTTILRLGWTFVVVVWLAGLQWGARASALDSVFTYQGQVLKAGAPYNGTCDFRFQLFDAPSGGTAVTSLDTAASQIVSNGLFTLTPNFGPGPFSGADRWLEVSVRCPDGAGDYTTLGPRQQLTATPYAFYASTAGSANDLVCTDCVSAADIADGAVGSQQLADGAVTSAKIFDGSIAPATLASPTPAAAPKAARRAMSCASAACRPAIERSRSDEHESSHPSRYTA